MVGAQGVLFAKALVEIITDYAMVPAGYVSVPCVCVCVCECVYVYVCVCVCVCVVRAETYA